VLLREDGDVPALKAARGTLTRREAAEHLRLIDMEFGRAEGEW